MQRFGFGRHKNFYVAVLLGLLTGAILLALAPSYALPSAANVFFLTYTLLTTLAALEAALGRFGGVSAAEAFYAERVSNPASAESA